MEAGAGMEVVVKKPLFYGRHALPMLELYREKKVGWRVGAASNRAGNVEEYLLM